ncbi:MAG TPA: glycosyltransferase family 2 protein [Flavobacteriales bacterium]|nr:glycosyltransferase family 2 protein [Flavobacteriales bacterium]
MLSTVIITLNEKRNIERCVLSAQKVSDEVIVVDSFSTDRTEEICRQIGVRFFQEEWKGYSAAKNFGNSLATNEWILSLDADEEITDVLAEEIRVALNKNDREAYWIPRMTNYCGKWIKHGGWYPEKHIRLFRKTNVRWNEDEVHEDVEITGETGTLKNPMLHYSIRSISEHVQKAEKYSTLSALKMKRKGKRASFVKLYLGPLFKFWNDYLS